MSSPYKPCVSTTGIGSVPFTDPEEAVKFLLESDLSIPFWPQLPKRCFAEEMIPQYCTGVPCVRFDTDRRIVSFDNAGKSEELETFYQRFLEEDPAPFALSSDNAAGFTAFEQQVPSRKWPVVKGQITGPITMTTGIYDSAHAPLFIDADLRDAVVKALVRNVQWQIGRLKQFASGQVLMFVDEPVLAAFGSSAYVYLSEADVKVMLGEVFEAINGAGGITGIHVCGNCDWGVVVRSGVQVINFDAYQYGSSISLYADDVRAFFERGGSVAWGIVPTTNVVARETVDSLVERLSQCFAALEKKGFPADLIRERAILTPSCGAGSLPAAEARHVFSLLRGVRDSIVQ